MEGGRERKLWGYWQEMTWLSSKRLGLILKSRVCYVCYEKRVWHDYLIWGFERGWCYRDLRMWCDRVGCDMTELDVIWQSWMWYDIVGCGVMWCDVMWCDVTWCDVMWCDRGDVSTWFEVTEILHKAFSIAELLPVHEMQQRKQFLDVVLK